MSGISFTSAERIPPSGDGSDDSEFCTDCSDPVLLGESAAVRHLRSQIRRIAPYFRIALIRGETGAGKQHVARAIHARSPAAQGRFVVVHASALAQAFDDASMHPRQASGMASLLESAEGGTLYLKCIGELSFVEQAALFRFLQTRERFPSATSHTGRRGFERHEQRRSWTGNVGTRILAASERDLRTLAAVGRFRQDLYARLSAVEISVPPLRRRSEDIPVLATALLRRVARAAGQSAKLFAETTLLHLRERSWPENLPELEQVVTQAAALAEGGLIEPRHLLALVGSGVAGPGTAGSGVAFERLDDVIERHVLDVLTRCGGNKLRAAELLGISRSTLYRMLAAKPAAMRLAENEQTSRMTG